MANRISKIFNALGLSDPIEDSYEDYYESEETSTDEYNTLCQENHAPSNNGQAFYEAYRANPEMGLSPTTDTPETSRNNTLVFGKAAEVVILEPTFFEEVPFAIQALRSQKLVVLNLFKMEADQAQRAVDFLAGGTFIVDGDLEKVSETIFIFTPHHIKINHQQAHPQSRPEPTYPGQSTPLYYAPSSGHYTNSPMGAYSQASQRVS